MMIDDMMGFSSWASTLRGRSFVTIRSSDVAPPLSYPGFTVLPGIDEITEGEAKV
jgi:hypothetical protein